MKTPLFLCIAIFAAQSSFCQNNYNSSVAITATTPGINTKPIQTNLQNVPQYDLLTVDKKLKTARRCIIAGSVLTASGGALFIAGFATAFPGRNTEAATGHKSSGNFLPFALMMAGIPFIVTGIPPLAVGLTQRRKWQKIKGQINIQSGILSNGHVGFAMNF